MEREKWNKVVFESCVSRVRTETLCGATDQSLSL